MKCSHSSSVVAEDLVEVRLALDMDSPEAAGAFPLGAFRDMDMGAVMMMMRMMRVDTVSTRRTMPKCNLMCDLGPVRGSGRA